MYTSSASRPSFKPAFDPSLDGPDLDSTPAAKPARVDAPPERLVDGVDKPPGAGAAPSPLGPLPGGPASLFVTGTGDAGAIDANDVAQGGVADCYMLASIGAVAKANPQAIANMIRENRDDTGKVQSYTVTLWDKESTWFGLSSKNRKNEITVDANFPTDGRRANPSGDTDAAGTQEIWPMVIEKAFAQMKGGYHKIDYGHADAALFALTGKDARNYSMADTKQRVQFGRGTVISQPPAVTWDSLKADFDQKKPVTFATQDKDGLSYNLVKNHVYTVDGFSTDASGKKMVELRNPWGSDHTTVPWDDLQKVGQKLTVGRV